MKITAAAVLAILAGTALPTGARANCSDPTIRINAESISDEDVAVFEKKLRTAIGKVCAWWGPTFDGPYTVNIKDKPGPSMAMIPAWRGHHGTMLFRSGKTRKRRSPILHEVVHIFAPNANRLLAEGLAVYAHEHLGGQPAYPTFGKDLHQEARPLAAGADLAALDTIVVPKGLRIEDRKQQRRAYTVAGSFVRYLIETEGFDKFRTLYAITPMVPGERIPSDPTRWQSVYGRSLADLTRSWRQYVAER